MKEFLINAILVVIFVFFVMQIYQLYKDQKKSLEEIRVTLQNIDRRLSDIEFIAE